MSEKRRQCWCGRSLPHAYSDLCKITEEFRKRARAGGVPMLWSSRADTPADDPGQVATCDPAFQPELVV